MFQQPFEDFQYDSCISRGICSINPRILALQTVLVLYLRIFSKQALGLELDSKDKDFILNTISVAVNNPEFNEKSFLYATKKFKILLPKFMDNFSDKNIDLEKKKLMDFLEETMDIVKAIKYGEQILNQSQKALSTDIRNLFNIILFMTKNLSIKLLVLESYGLENPIIFEKILKLLSRINIDEKNIEELKSEIYEATKFEAMLMTQIHQAQEERYGKQNIAEVSYTTVPNKAVLVVGSNIRELENILESLKNEKIDVYTHDDMMLAYTFPKFIEYPRLKGQFGLGLENCLIDFATFPGPIILTQNSLHNVENFYRGLLFTTDYTTAPKGVIKIVNKDFSEVITSAYSAKGFKTGKQCETVTVGYNFEELSSNIKEKITKGNYDKIFIIGLEGYSLEQKSYFEKLIKITPENVLILTFSYFMEKDNVVYIKACFDHYVLLKLFDYVYNFNLPITIFMPKCEKNSISQMIYLSGFENVQVYVGKCISVLLNPNLLKSILKMYSIKNLTTARKDIDEIFKGDCAEP